MGAFLKIYIPNLINYSTLRINYYSFFNLYLFIKILLDFDKTQYKLVHFNC